MYRYSVLLVHNPSEEYYSLTSILTVIFFFSKRNIQIHAESAFLHQATA